MEPCQGSYHLQGNEHGRLCLKVSFLKSFIELIKTSLSRKKSHTIEGHVVTVARAEPEPEPPGEEEEDLPEEEDEYGMTMIKKMKMSLEGVLDADRDTGEGGIGKHG